MEFCNGVLLQLIECIESTQNEVKRKMIETGACSLAPKSHERLARKKMFRAHHKNALGCSQLCRACAAHLQETSRRCPLCDGAHETSSSIPPSIMKDDLIKTIIYDALSARARRASNERVGAQL
jgi:hypothetical protein